MTLDAYKKALHEQPTTLVLVGPSGAGKSTLAGRLAERDDQVVATDEMRRLLTGDPSAMEASGVAQKLALSILEYRAGHHSTTIYDSTALDTGARGRITDRVNAGRCWALIVEASREACLSRQDERGKDVPVDVVRKQHDKLGDLEFVPGRFERIDCYRTEPDEFVEVAG